jgi:molybdenum cofactor cytidylyltransferase
MAAPSSIGAVVLAAGTSSRMGAPKLLLPLGDRPVIARVMSAVSATSATPVALVFGPAAERVRAALPPGRWEAVLNRAYHSGMASSLRAGTDWLEAQPAVETLLGAVVLLGDQPLVTREMIESLLQRAHEQPERIWAATYSGERRHPVYFPRALFAELQALRGDEGGRSVVARHRDRLEVVEMEPPEAAMDVDTPEEYARVLAYWNQRYGTPAD